MAVWVSYDPTPQTPLGNQVVAPPRDRGQREPALGDARAQPPST